MGHVLMENRNGLVVSARLTQASGIAERDACLDMLEDAGANRRITLGGDKNYDVHDFVDTLRSLNVTPHVDQNDTNRKSAIDRRTTGIPAMRSACANANASKKYSAGSKPWAL